MLSGSTILRISLLLVVAGCLAALIQYFLPHAPSPAQAPPVAVPPASVAPAPRKVGTPPLVPSPAAPRADLAAPPVSPEPAPTPAPAPQPTAEAPVLSQSVPEPQPTGQAEVNEAGDSAGPRALALVDLNTASLAELNGLRGGGSIGRAIIQRRPYTTIDQLLSKRVLSRATYDKIKDQITIR